MNLIDLCVKWLEERQAAYLAKENMVVYYATTTGRKSDFQWITHSLVEVVRIIRATLMNPDDSDKLKSKHVIAACQELDRVFEFGIKAKHDTRPEIFNYLKESGESMGDAIVSLLAETLLQRGYTALLLNDVYELVDRINKDLSVMMSFPAMKNLIDKHFTSLGYDVRTGPYRPQWQGKKQSAVMLHTAKPRDIIMLSGDNIVTITKQITGALR